MDIIDVCDIMHATSYELENNGKKYQNKSKLFIDSKHKKKKLNQMILIEN